MPVSRTKWSSFLTRKPPPLVRNGKSLPKTFLHPKAKRGAKRLQSIPGPRHGQNMRTRSQCSNQTDVSATKPWLVLLSSHTNLNWFQSGDKTGHTTARWCPNIPTFSIPSPIFPSVICRHLSNAAKLPYPYNTTGSLQLVFSVDAVYEEALTRGATFCHAPTWRWKKKTIGNRAKCPGVIRRPKNAAQS